MKVSIIGSGNVATHLALALSSAKFQILNIWSNTYENAQILAQQVSATPVQSIIDISLSQADIIFIAVKDDYILEVANQLTNFKGIVAHTSGAVGIDSLLNLLNSGVFYPLQTFSKGKTLNFNQVPLCIEANNNSTLKVLKNVATTISENVYEVDSKKRSTLHVAAVFACNFPNYLYQIANELLTADNLPFDIIRPLISETASKVQNTLPFNVQTGPAIRNDEKTLAKHEELLNTHPEWLHIYKLLSNEIKNSKL